MLDERTCSTVAAWGWQTCPTHSTITRDDDTLTMFSRAVYKIFKESNKDVICHIRQCLGLHDIDVLCKERHEIFLRRTGLLRYAVLHSLMEVTEMKMSLNHHQHLDNGVRLKTRRRW